jgi:[protein-PII] uridylyltransferase
VISATTPCSPDISILNRRRELAYDEGLDARAFATAYTAAVDTWMTTLLGAAGEGIALVAVGSYGRRELCPGSDLDLVLVHRQRRDVAEIADRIWYPIWDSGLRLDHSVRTVGQALDMAQTDLKVLLGLLDARVVAGDGALGDEVARGALDLWRRHAPRWLEPLEQQCRARHARAGEVAYLLEPDLKEGRGGQRDVTVLRSLGALGVPGGQRPDLLRAADTLLSVRVAVQRRVGRAEERLLLEEQDEVATMLGDRDADALMTRLASAARTVTWVFDDAWRAVRVRPRRRASTSIKVGPGIAVRDDEIVLTDAADPFGDDSLLLRIAGGSAYFGVPIAAATVERLIAATPRMTRTWTEEAREAFVALLGAGDVAIQVVEGLDQLGLWTRVIPEWAAVRSLPQRNAFHRYTVDRHLLEAVARATRFIRRVARPDLLLVGALLHDIGKGFPGDHTDAGVDVAEMLATRMGFPPHDVAIVVDIVRYHLLLPAVATSRDLDDDATIVGVADAIGSVQLLELLHALVEADSLATGDTAWTPWKAELVDELVDRVRDRFGGPPFEAGALNEPAESLLSRFDGTLTVEAAGRHISVVAPDRPALLATVVGVLALHGHSVRTARARSADDGIAVSSFDIEQAATAPDAGAIEHDVTAALDGRLQLEARLTDRAQRARALRRPRAAHPAQPVVIFDNAGSTNGTIVEVRAPDGVGVLYRTTNALATLGLDIRHAKVSTLGHEVIDTFYVVDSDGEKIADSNLLGHIEKMVLEALTPTTEEAPGRSDSRQDSDENA